MKTGNLAQIAGALLAGAALGYGIAFFVPGPEPQAEPPPTEKAPARPKAAAADDAAGERAALRARVRELEGLLAQKGAEAEKVDEGERARRERPRHDPRAEMERIKREDPARYTQITNGMAQFRRQRLARAQSKMDFLSSIDTSGMSPAMLKVHSDLQDMIEKREAVEDRMRGFMDMNEEERQATFREMHEIDGKIRELNQVERDNLLVKTAEALGFQGDEAAEIIDTVKSIYEATDSGFRFGPPGGPRGPGGPGRRDGPGGRGGNGQ